MMEVVGKQVLRFDRSRELAERLRRAVPGGSHTYAKGPDQFPEESPAVIVQGRGSHVWDADGNEFIEFGMGLRSVALGHAYPGVVDAVRASLELGTNFSRPAAIELECAETFLDLFPTAEMVKFTKDGSTATSAAVKLARRATGRDLVAMCAEHPFFSYDDWFMTTTTTAGGIPHDDRLYSVPFSYNDLESLERCFMQFPNRIGAVILEPVRTDAPLPDFLPGVRRLCDTHGAVLVFDEMITGFRYALHGAQDLYGVVPDLSTFGKAMANGFSLSALAGRRDLMMLGGRRSQDDDVFLLSTTHGAETPSLAAAIATMRTYAREPVIEHLYRQGERLVEGFRSLSAEHGLSDYVFPFGFACNLLFATHGPDRRPSQEFRTLFLQELIQRGVLAPSLVVSYSHDDLDIERTLSAVDGSLGVYSSALEQGSTEQFLVGPPSRPVFERRWH
jgi:glutamate-1-semialdehyde 2,1-aminomutase